MKNLNLIYTLLLLSIFTSCQKDHPVKVETSGNKPPVIAAVHDSVSYTVDGKTYSPGLDAYSFISSGSQETGRKVVYADTNNKFNYGLVGDPDSVLYYQKNTILSDNTSLNIFFIKKFRKVHANDGILYAPLMKDWLQLFTVGEHPFAEDFGWENSQDGIAMTMTFNDKVYKTYNAFDPRKPSILKPGFQKDATFEIISFTKSTDGTYNLEARFTAVITDTYETKKMENGYLRLNLSPVAIRVPTD